MGTIFFGEGFLFNIAIPILLGTTLAFGWFVSVANADSCTVKPLVLPIMNVTLRDGIAMNRGIRVVLGNQIQGLRMSTQLSNTRLRNFLDCTESIVACEGSSGGVYSTTDSFKPVHNLKDWNVTAVDNLNRPTDGTTVLQGYDVANFTDAPAVIPDFPFEVWANHDALNKSALALGPKSSFLNRLVDHGLAPSSAFSIDYGSRSQLHSLDGEFIIGGINEARYDARTKAEFPLWGAVATVNCPLQVSIADVILQNDRGNHTLFSDPDQRLPACIEPLQNAFTFTPKMFSKWQEVTSHVDVDTDGSAFGPQSYPLANEGLMGTLTIKLAIGGPDFYTVTIPHYELVTQERGTDPVQGKYVVTNASRVMAAVQSGQSDLGIDVPILGGVFLSLNYLHVDYDAQKFWLSPVMRDGGAGSIVPTCAPAGNKTESIKAPTGSPNSTLAIALPVCIAVVVLVLIAWFWYNRSDKKRSEKKSNPATATSDQGKELHRDQISIVPKAHGDQIPIVSEVHGNQTPIVPKEVHGDQIPIVPKEVHGDQISEFPASNSVLLELGVSGQK